MAYSYNSHQTPKQSAAIDRPIQADYQKATHTNLRPTNKRVSTKRSATMLLHAMGDWPEHLHATEGKPVHPHPTEGEPAHPDATEGEPAHPHAEECNPIAKKGGSVHLHAKKGELAPWAKEQRVGCNYYEAYAGWPHGLASAGSATPTQGGESKTNRLGIILDTNKASNASDSIQRASVVCKFRDRSNDTESTA